MIKPVTLLFCLCYSTAFSQIEVDSVRGNAIPSGANYQGTVADVISIKDKQGTSSVIVSRTPVQASKTWADSRESELFIYRYLMVKTGAQLQWKVYDFIKECPLDVDVTLLGGTHSKGISVTDLDNDNDAEVWIGYRTVCRGDVSPATVKIIMYEGKSKHAVRGTSKIKVSDNQYDGGKFEFDRAFQNAPQQFRSYAQRVWEEIVTE
jgi:hypothetical protein